MSLKDKKYGAGWGGQRTGAGRKVQVKRGKHGVNVLVTFPPSSEPDPRLKEPPAGLTERQRALWREWAPLALEKRTLSHETVPAFVMLCELQGFRQTLREAYERDGKTENPAEMRLYLQLAKQVEGLMGRFCLAPFGKPVVSEKPKQAVNPFAQVIGQ